MMTDLPPVRYHDLAAAMAGVADAHAQIHEDIRTHAERHSAEREEKRQTAEAARGLTSPAE